MDGHPGRLSGQPCADEGARHDIPAGFIREGKPAVSGGYRRFPGAHLSAGYRRLPGNRGETLSSPVGLFVDQNNELYVADNGLGAVVKFSPEGEVLHRYDRPDSAAFGTETTYSPSKVAVNSSGTLYVVSDGSYDGMIQLDQNGEFLGYFGYNNNPITAWEYLQDLLFTDEMKAQLFSRVPYSFGNVDIDTKGILYSVTQSAEGNAIKKHDVARAEPVGAQHGGRAGFCGCLYRNGRANICGNRHRLVFEYDMDGHLLFTFGGRAIAVEQNGVFATASAHCQRFAGPSVCIGWGAGAGTCDGPQQLRQSRAHGHAGNIAWGTMRSATSCGTTSSPSAAPAILPPTIWRNACSRRSSTTKRRRCTALPAIARGTRRPSGISATNGSARRCRICCLGWRSRRPR